MTSSDSDAHGKEMAKHIFSFSNNLENLREFVEVVGSVLEQKMTIDFSEDPESIAAHFLAFHEVSQNGFQLENEQLEKMKKACNGMYEIETSTSDEGGPRVNINPKDGDRQRLRAATESLVKAMKRERNLYRSSLMSLVSEGEWLCAQLLHCYFERHPEAVGLKEKNFSYEELVKFSTILDAKKYIIDNKVEDILRGSFSEWVIFFKDKMKISTGLVEAHLPYGYETNLRRNLLVHNGGFVNQHYLNKLPVEISDRPKIGGVIEVTRDYFSDRIDRFEIIFLIIAFEIWGKLAKDDPERGVAATGLGFEALLKERYLVAEVLSKYGMRDKGIASDLRGYAQVNYWQSFKWRGRIDEVRADIVAWDVNAMDQKYRAAKFALLDQDEECISIVRSALKADILSLNDVKVWPIFKNIRDKI